MSGFVIKYIDIYNLLWEYKEKLETLIEDIGYCENSINDFITSTAFQGEAANSIKNYMNEVHITLLSGFKVTAQNILDNLILYKAGYYEIDSSTNFVLPEEEIKAFRTKLNGNALDTEEYADKVNRKLGEVSDIYQVSHPDTNGVFKIHQQIDQELLNFLTDIETQEQTTVTVLEQSAELLISGLKNCVSKIESIDITNYESNSFYQDAEVYALAGLSQNCYQNHETYKGIYDEIWNNEQGLRDAADARETQGIWKTVGGVFLVVGGTVCIVASGGAATPIVAAGWTAGGGTIAFGVADSIEGAQDIYYGSIGDIDSTSMNYLKSVVFQGNEDAYYLTENVFAFASSAFIPISQAARVGNLTFRSGMTTVAKEEIAMMAGAGASDVTMRVTGSQTASVVAGMLTSWGTGHGLNGVDTRFNISGNRVKNGSVSRVEGTGYKELTGYEYLDTQLGSLKGKVKINQYQSAESVNEWWAARGYKSPYKTRTVVQNITLTEDTKFVRVYDGVNSSLEGGWVMRAEDIKGLTPKQIQAKFALEYEPKYIGEVELKAGDTIRLGEVGPNFGFDGGGIQIDLQQQWIGDFREIGKIEEWR